MTGGTLTASRRPGKGRIPTFAGVAYRLLQSDFSESRVTIIVRRVNDDMINITWSSGRVR